MVGESNLGKLVNVNNEPDKYSDEGIRVNSLDSTPRKVQVNLPLISL